MPEPSALPSRIATLQRQLDASLVETHCSWVLIGRDEAWKIKKPITLPFLDYATPALREAACREEIRLNRRLAPDLYLGVVAVGTPDAPEWAVHMRHFDGRQQLDRLCSRGELRPKHLAALALTLRHFQSAAAVAGAASRFGDPQAVVAPALENFEELRQLLPAADQPQIESLAAWTTGEFERLQDVFTARKTAAFIREGHGDLHLANLVLIDGEVTPFDGIEFSEDLRWIDVASDIAFTWIDLLDHHQPGLAGWWLSSWREASGDTGALVVMRFYAVYRALVRAKIAAIRAAQEPEPEAQTRNQALSREYLALAASIATLRRGNMAPVLTITVGPAGAGKSTASRALVLTDPQGECLRLRSDVERKRLFGLDALDSSHTAVAGGIYSPEANRQTYARLHDDAETLLASGWSVVVDAAFLRQTEREQFRQLAARLGLPFRILECTAPSEVLRQRVEARKGDASEATVAVLEQQLQWLEPLTADEASLRMPLPGLG
jgi:aminoglycoside phosphotransferase family enzyme/predicted kinase